MIIACCGIVLSYITLLLSMNKKYLDTFIGTKTGNEHCHGFFTDNEEDWKKFGVFHNNRHKWEYKIGPEVKAWLNERLPVWLEDEPEWFNDVMKSMIPDEFISDPALLVRVRTKNVKAIIEERRRSSILVALAPDAGQAEGADEEDSL
jgi:hypothetical protein